MLSLDICKNVRRGADRGTKTVVVCLTLVFVLIVGFRANNDCLFRLWWDRQTNTTRV